MRLNKNQSRLVSIGFRLLEDDHFDVDGNKLPIDPSAVALVKEMRLALWGDVKVVSNDQKKPAQKKGAEPKKGNAILGLVKNDA